MESLTEIKRHYDYIDLAAGIMISRVILIHLLPRCESGDIVPMIKYPFIGVLFFAMPWFFYKSGQFFKLMPIRELWGKDKVKLLRAFLQWSIVGYVIYIVCLAISGTLLWRAITYTVFRHFLLMGSVLGNEALWFLLSLIVVRFVANLSLRCVHPLVLILAGMTVAWGCHLTQFRLMPCYVANVSSGLCFFAMGYWLSQHETKWRMAAVTALIFIGFALHGLPLVDMAHNELKQGIYLLWFPCSLCGIVLFNNICRILVWVRKQAKAYLHLNLSLFTYIGRNAMWYYVLHLMVLNITSCVINNYVSTSLQFGEKVVIYLAACVLTLPTGAYLLNRYKKRKATTSTSLPKS